VDGAKSKRVKDVQGPTVPSRRPKDGKSGTIVAFCVLICSPRLYKLRVSKYLAFDAAPEHKSKRGIKKSDVLSTGHFYCAANILFRVLVGFLEKVQMFHVRINVLINHTTQVTL
jgi:hypothetical protein